MPRAKTTRKRRTTTTTKRKTMARKATTKGKTAKRRVTAKGATARKTTRRTTTTRKATTRGKTTRKAAPRKKTMTTLKLKDPLKKSQLYSHIAECTELSRKEISTVFETLADVIKSHLKKGGPGEFTVPGLMKCKVTRKKATKARKGINPFTGEETMFKAKPARNVIKVRPLKRMKEMAN